MHPKNHLLSLSALCLLPISIANAIPIAATNFDGQTITDNTASDLNWTLNGIEDPGSMSALVSDTGAAQNLFNLDPLTQNQFAPLLNVGNNNTWWRTSVNLTVLPANAVTLSDVTFDYWAINGGGTQNVGRRSDFTITLYDPSDTVVATVSILDALNGAPQTPAGLPTAVSLPFPTLIGLTEPGTYRLEIDGGELGGDDETGNHAGIDNLSINGTTGVDTTAPTPDPMSFAVAPAAIDSNSIIMTAETASDESLVEYLFNNTTLGTDSGWQDGTEWTDIGLTPGTQYTYTVSARDKSVAQNTTAPSAAATATTTITDLTPPSPDPMTFATRPRRVDNTSVTMTATTATDSSGVEYLFQNLTLATDSGWQASTTWIDTGLTPGVTYDYTVTARDTAPAQTATSPSATASVNLIPIIATTSFDGQVISGNSTSGLNWIVNGVEDPGAMVTTRLDTGADQNLFNSNAFNQNQFAPQLNYGNTGTAWRTSVNLTPSPGAAITLTEVAFDYWAINGGGNQNVLRASDFTITLYDPSGAVVGTDSILDIPNGATVGESTPVSLVFPSALTLSAVGTYRLEIDGGELGGTDETGNHAGIDNLAIIGTNGAAVAFAITDFEYNPDANPDPTVTLTWQKTGAQSYTVKVSKDMTSWDTDIGDSLTAALDERPEDPDQITVTLFLPPGPAFENELFIRVEEES